ncbi:hypothetical protein [Methanohalobium sp.]|uniref:hypothetical protein n=1 Tax=Methanohalobium sp. TaxID=2837493 RepID=UPI0025D15D47|nr:hypothetical protein [Methanohalobium sp.]
MQPNNDFLGLNNFVWFHGVVEDRNDPLKLGRIRVRIFGWHTENKNLVPTSSLPWAMPVQAITSAATSGVGQSPTGPVEGTWVIGFFQDGGDGQIPIILGTTGGIPSSENSQTGFSDPNGKYPRYTGEPDTNPRARNEGVEKRTDQKKVTSAFGASWTEPSDPYAAVYPYNHIYESESGHVQEYDDTTGNERTFKKHRTGTFEEVHPDGSRVTKIVANDYEIVAEDKNVWIKGVCNITVDNTCNMKVKEFNLEVENDMNVKIGGNYEENVGGDQTTQVSGSIDIDGSRVDIN